MQQHLVGLIMCLFLCQSLSIISKHLNFFLKHQESWYFWGDNAGTLKITHEHHKTSISQFTMSSRSAMAKVVSRLGDRMAVVENKINAALLSRDTNHDMMQLLMLEMSELKDDISRTSFT